MGKLGLWLVVGLLVWLLLSQPRTSARVPYYGPYGGPPPGPGYYSSPPSAGPWSAVTAIINAAGGAIGGYLSQPPAAPSYGGGTEVVQLPPGSMTSNADGFEGE